MAEVQPAVEAQRHARTTERINQVIALNPVEDSAGDGTHPSMSVHHSVQVRYPAFYNPDLEDFAEPSRLGVARVGGVYQMHEPLRSLFFYAQPGGDKAGRYTLASMRLPSYYQTGLRCIDAAQLDDLRRRPNGGVAEPDPDTQLRDWINTVSVYPGHTDLLLNTFRRPDDAEAILRTEAIVSTLFDQVGFPPLQVMRTYRYVRTSQVNDTPDGLFHWPFGHGNALHISNIDNVGTQWADDLKRAILGVSQRTIGHRLLSFEGTANTPGQAGPFLTLRGQYRFKDERQPDYAAVLPEALTMVRPDEGSSTSCPICMNDFEWNDGQVATFTSPRSSADPVSTGPNSPKTLQPPSARFAMALSNCPVGEALPHVICLPCLLKYCQRSAGPKEAACVLCRAPVFGIRELNHLLYDEQRNSQPWPGLEDHPNERYIFCNNPNYEPW